jgi:carbon-monoxide dehydrogenase small subunit
MLLAIQANNSDITTVEGLSQNGVLSVVQQAFIDNHAVQCGYCTPAALVVVTELLNRNLNPTEADMREQLDGVLCRCTGYQNIVLAGLAAAQTLRGAT